MAAAFVELQVDGHPVEALLDSGAARSAIVERPGLTRSVVGDPSVGVFGVHSDQQRALAAVRFAGQDLGSLEVEVVPADQATRPLVGQDVLSRFRCEYRLADGVLILDGDLPHDCGGRVPGNPTAIHTLDPTTLTLPLAFLSSAIMSREVAPDWIQHVTDYNPVDWAVTASRSALSASPDWGGIGLRLGGLAVVALGIGWLATRSFRTYQRSL